MTTIVESSPQNMYKVYQAIDRIITTLLNHIDSSVENKIPQNELLRKLGVSEDDIKEHNAHFLAFITATRTHTFHKARQIIQKFDEDAYHRIRNKVLNGEIEVY